MKLRYVFALLFVVAAASLLMIYKPWRGGKLIEDEGAAKPARSVRQPAGVKANPSIKKQNDSQEKPVKTMSMLKKDVEKALLDFPGKASAVFYDYESETSFSIDGEESFESASLVKIPIMYEIFRQIQEGEYGEDKELVLEDDMKTGGAGVLKDKPSGSKWKVIDLITLMISESDNTAADMLIELAGMKNIEKTAVSLGMKQTTLRRKIYDFAQIDKGHDNYISPVDMMIILRAIVENDGIEQKYCSQMIEIMKKQKMRDRIPKLLPPGVECANKTGGLTGLVHDCAIIYPSDRKPYILVLMGKNVTDEAKAKEVYAKVSLMIYMWVK
jgi:beta-lactamase class A